MVPFLIHMHIFTNILNNSVFNYVLAHVEYSCDGHSHNVMSLSLRIAGYYDPKGSSLRSPS